MKGYVLRKDEGEVHESGSRSVPKSVDGWSTINSEVPIQRSPPATILPSEFEAASRSGRRCAYSVSSQKRIPSKPRAETPVDFSHGSGLGERHVQDLARVSDRIAPIYRLPFRVTSARQPNPRPEPTSTPHPPLRSFVQKFPSVCFFAANSKHVGQTEVYRLWIICPH